VLSSSATYFLIKLVYRYPVKLLSPAAVANTEGALSFGDAVTLLGASPWFVDLIKCVSRLNHPIGLDLALMQSALHRRTKTNYPKPQSKMTESHLSCILRKGRTA